jgi:hypothetical protein
MEKQSKRREQLVTAGKGDKQESRRGGTRHQRVRSGGGRWEKEGDEEMRCRV